MTGIAMLHGPRQFASEGEKIHVWQDAPLPPRQRSHSPSIAVTAILGATLTLAMGVIAGEERRLLAAPQGNRLIQVRLEAAAGERLIVGQLAPSVTAVIQNMTGERTQHVAAVAVALRGVHWTAEHDDARQWLGPQPGSVSERRDGSFIRNPLESGSTELRFERGLIVPGGELRVPVPFTPRPGGRHSLVVKYVIISGTDGWRREVWLREPIPSGSPDGEAEIYRVATAGHPAERSAGSPALVRATARLGTTLPVQDIVRTFDLPAEQPAPQTLRPVDDAPKDPSLLAFRAALLRAIERRDATQLLSVVDPGIEFSFGKEPGIAGFRAHWKLDRRTSAFWRELRDVLTLGGTLTQTPEGKAVFTAPYVFGRLPRGIDAVIIKAAVPLRSRPSSGAPVVRTLSYDLVTFVDQSLAEKPDAWMHVRVADGVTGYVQRRDVRSPLDYRAIFEKIDGRWRMTVFIAGD